MIGQHYHSQYCIRILKQASLGRLCPPYEVKFPKYFFEDFDKSEVMTVIDKQMIGNNLYLVTFQSDNFYYFMSHSRQLQGCSLSIYTPELSGQRVDYMPICNRLINFRLTNKVHNRQLLQFRYFQYLDKQRLVSNQTEVKQ